MDVVCFRLPGHGDVAMRNMNALRESLHFCDITIMAGGKKMFRGHKVVLAACSAYLRDQFLLNPSAELQVSVLHNSTVMRELLQSCYTGILRFSAKEIVNYLTAASYLQMEHVVEKCRGALSRYLQPKNDSALGTMKAEDSQSIPVIVSGSATAASEHTSSLQPHSSEEEPQAPDMEDQSVQQRDDEELSMRQARASDPSGCIQDEDGRNDFSVFQVHIKDDRHENEEDADVHEHVGEALEVMGVQARGDEQSREDAGGAGSSQRAGVRYWRRRYGEPRRGRGRGFKHRRRYTFHERRPMGNFQQAWRFPTSDEILGNFGADIGADYLSAQAMTDGALQLEYQQAEGQGNLPGSDTVPAHFNIDGSGADEDIGVVALPTDEEGRGDDSVVGSTSCVTGTVACEHCGLAFSSVQDLAVHSRSTHLLYVCPCCGKHFSHSSNLSRHMVVHRTTKLHTCPLCHKTFTQKSTLCDHMNMHSGERPHVCAFCHVCFAHKPALRRHLKEQHGKTTAQNYMEIQRESQQVVGGEV